MNNIGPAVLAMRIVRVCWLFFIIAFTSGTVLPEDNSKLIEPINILSADQLFIKVQDDRLTVNIRGVALQEVLNEIADQSGVKFVLNGPLEERVSTEFRDLPLDVGVRNLLKEQNYLLLYAPGKSKEGVEKLTEVWVYRAKFLPDPLIAASGRQWREDGKPSGLAGPGNEMATESIVRTQQDKNADKATKEKAIETLEDLGNERAIAALTQMVLEESDGSLRRRTVEALGYIGGEAVVETLSRTLLEDADESVRVAALFALQEVGQEIEGEMVHEALRAVLYDKDKWIGALAEVMLEKLHSGEK